jgi:branched-chain amino acid transport system ATP-binding protein
MAKPRLLMLDEPTLGLAPIMARLIFETLARLRAAGLTILLAEQDVAQTLALADRAYVLENGRIALEGSGRELLDDPRVKAAYLGL